MPPRRLAETTLLRSGSATVPPPVVALAPSPDSAFPIAVTAALSASSAAADAEAAPAASPVAGADVAGADGSVAVEAVVDPFVHPASAAATAKPHMAATGVRRSDIG